MDLFLQPICNHLKSLSVDGFKLQLLHQDVNMKAYTIGCCVDSGARGAVEGLNSHSGYYSCNWCEIVGEYCDHKVVFPFQDFPAKLRTHMQILSSMQQNVLRMVILAMFMAFSICLV